MRQWLAESAVLAALAGSAGLLCAYWLTRMFVATAPPGIPRLDQSGVSAASLFFCATVAAVMTVATGLPPLFHAFRSSAHATLTQAGRH